MNTSNHICNYKHARWLDNGFRRLIHNPEKLFRNYISPGNTILDIGCGPGTFTTGLAKLTGPNGKVIAIDLQDEMLQLAREKAASLGLLDQIEFHKCTSHSLNINIQADFILTFYMVHESPDPLKLITRYVNCLKAEGITILQNQKDMYPNLNMMRYLTGAWKTNSC